MFGFVASAFCSTPLFRGKHRIFSWLFRFVPFRTARSVYGVRMVRNVEDATYILCMVGYGRFISDIIARQSKPFCFMDIGANQGLFSLIAAQNPACIQAYAFEPNPQTFSLLVSNIAVNEQTSKVTPLCGAITQEGLGLLTFAQPTGHSGAANLFGKGDRTFTAIGLADGLLKAIFDACGNNAILAKIDVEGAEQSVLEALHGLGLLERLDGLIIEVSDRTGKSGQAGAILSFLRQTGWVEETRSGTSEHFDALFTQRR